MHFSFLRSVRHRIISSPNKHTAHTNANVVADLLISHCRNGDIHSARKLFEQMPERDVVACSRLISLYSRCGYPREALNVFILMKRWGVKANEFTYGSVLRACTELVSLQEGKMVQSCIIKGKYHQNIFVQSALIDLHAKCGRIEDALLVFQEMPERDIVSWNTILGGYAGKGFRYKALKLFRLMLIEGMHPDRYSLGSALRATCSCGTLSDVRIIHGLAVQLNCHSHDIVCGTLIDAYTKCGSLKDARLVYDFMERKDLVCLTSLITGYIRAKRDTSEALQLFSNVHSTGMKIDAILLCSMLSICADTANFNMGRQIHVHLVKRQSDHDVALANSLIDMYAKSGMIEHANQAFNEMPERNVISWTCLITGYGKNGLEKEATELFTNMENSGVQPNDVTFLGVLCACSHGGMTNLGKQWFDTMINDYRINPREEHYACVIDLFARAGLIKEAYELVCGMPIRPTASLWGALLGASLIYMDVAMGRIAAERLIAMEPTNSTNYVVISNIYASSGLWDDAENVRRLMKDRGLIKGAGWSSSTFVEQPFLLDMLYKKV